ncbi:putative dipeptidyl-peptidase [Monocercomonoides exilis]|uniref:putative dipeptidyl-peptidase n=1 Tax=Monocercomonoides exilis TaxID=2049356 RepID=UPI00355ABB79|nr:putative dipeptidyl-peptidase [Monocercomonoides exilis]|eukprot:MONOS_8416.1-p1 / transcript=MONOS_8416.1 / gene=MONOS_8416 / organism=Monocercomonoides_exilis_PA203 / gene_product=dipeptidyl-peptidase, putative / transcript_product=dipeptidyl-peptidase, putative / location=Mono_scaffold00316:50440-52642(+) / protein_length=714 / sequence_SO=supercontig / SO=protein_coding / is_pseudo=false
MLNVIVLIVSSLLGELVPFTAEMMKELETPNVVVSNSDNTRFAFLTVKTQLDLGQTTYRIYVSDGTAGGTKQIAQSTSIRDITWTAHPDVLAYFTDDNGNTKLVLLNVANENSKVVKEFPMHTTMLKWSPKGGVVCFVAYVYPGMNIEETANKDKEIEKLPYKMLVFDHTPVVDEVAYRNGKLAHVFYMIADNEESDFHYTFTKEPVDAMKSHKVDGPVVFPGTSDDFAVSPDDKYIAFSCLQGENSAFTNNRLIFLHDIGNPDKQDVIISPNDKRNTQPLFEPTEKWSRILYISTLTPNDETDITSLFEYNRETGQTRRLTEDFEYGIATAAWSSTAPDTILCTARIKGRTRAVVFDAVNGFQKSILPGSSITSVCQLGTQKYGYVKSTIAQPFEVYVYDSTVPNAEAKELDTTKDGWRDGDVAGETRVTKLTDAVLAKCYPLEPAIEYWYTGANNEKIQAFYVRPLFSPSSAPNTSPTPPMKWPLVMNIHGGPEWATNDEWDPNWNPEVFAHQGYGVFSPNPHGSDSFGKAFADSIHGRWGSWPYEDIMAGLAFILATDTSLDKDRVAAVGPSYAGYMMNWLNSHTDAFAGIVCHAGLFDLNTFYGETDIPRFMEREMKGLPWKPEEGNENCYEKWSPSFFANKYNTPMLVTHGGIDYRVPFDQGFMAFKTLQWRGVPSRFVFFPSEPHYILDPFNYVRWSKEILSWLRSYV